MKVLVAFEESQEICIEFRKLGHEAYSCDIQPCSGGHSEWHIQKDVFEIIGGGWDLVIAHPPCTRLTVTANKWYKPEFRNRFPTILQDREIAVKFFMNIVNCGIPKICIENPVGIMSTRYRKPDQYIQPYQFGHFESKKTGLWLFGLTKLLPTDIVEPNYIICKGKKYSPTHYNHIGGVKHGGKIRSKTYHGIAVAMAEQWG